jgi:hypothetical protein
VCRLHVAAGEKLHADKHLSGAIVRSVAKLAGINLQKCGSFSYWFDKTLVSQLRETCCCAHHTFLLGFQLGAYYAPSSIFLAPLPGIKKISTRGVSHAKSFTLLLFCFTLFLLALFYQKYKKKIPLIVCIPLLLLLVHYVVP